MGSIDDNNFVLTAEALNKALPDMHPSTRGIHADDFFTPHRAIAPGMHTAVNFRYAREAENLVPEENNDVSHIIASNFCHFSTNSSHHSQTIQMTPTYIPAIPHQTQSD